MRSLSARVLGPSVLMAALGLMVGCGSDSNVPTTHLVQGRVAFKGKGGRIERLVGGNVRLQSTSDPDLRAFGEIAEGGTFSVSIYLKDRSLSGVPAGEYRVAVEPPAEDDDGPRRLVIHPKYRAFDKSGITIKVPVAGEVVIEVEGPQR